MIHPAVLLLLCGGLLFKLQSLALPWLAGVTVCALLLALSKDQKRCWLMLRRMRWLLLASALLFALSSPGEYLAGLPGVSYEGLALAAHHVLYLLLFVALLCLMLMHLGNDGMVAALYALLLPLTYFGLNRDRAAVRLLLVMDILEQAPPENGWRAWLNHVGVNEVMQPMRLPLFAYTWRDVLWLSAGFSVMVWR